MRPPSLAAAATFSKDARTWGKDFYPSVLDRGHNAHVFTPGGDEYIDWVSALGANLLGYSNPIFCEAVCHQVFRGAGFSLQTTLEWEVANRLVDMLGETVPGWSPEKLQVRFGKTGTDVTNMAVRLARAVTGRNLILKGKGMYHGWGDWTISTTLPAFGIPSNTRDWVQEFEPENIYDLWKIRDDNKRAPIAAVILEHPLNTPYSGWYRDVRNFCDDVGALFIMDEVVTGLRFAMGGACELYDIHPDLVCYGKALGNGLPISALVGWRELMEWFGRTSPVFCSGTHFGDAVSLAAANAVLNIFDRISVRCLWGLGAHLMKGLSEAGWEVQGMPPRSLMVFKTLAERIWFVLGMRDHNILMNRPNFPNLGHTYEDVEATIQAAQQLRSSYLETRAMDGEQMDVWAQERAPWILFKSR